MLLGYLFISPDHVYDAVVVFLFVMVLVLLLEVIFAVKAKL